jgi:EpsI family protein
MRTRVIIIFVALLVAAGAGARADRYEEVPTRSPLMTLPMQIGEWRGVQQPGFTKEILDVLRVDDYLTRVYRGPERASAGLYIGFWKSQRQGDTIHSPLNCLPGAGWEPVSHAILQFADPRNPASPNLAVNRYVIQKGIDRQLVLYWYQSHGRIVASEYWGKFYLVADAVRMNRTDGAIVRVIAPITGETPEAEQQAERNALRFVKVLFPQLDGLLPL